MSPDRDDVVQREDRVGHEEDHVYRKIQGDQDGDLLCPSLIETPHPDRPAGCDRQQCELYIPEIPPKNTGIQFGRQGIDGAVSRRKRTTRIDRVRDQRRRHPDQLSGAEADGLQESLPGARQHERAGEEQKISRRQEQVRQAEIDGEADQQARNAVRTGRYRGMSPKNLAVR